MTIKLKLPGMPALIGCAAAACACATWMGMYFGAAWGSVAGFFTCFLLFVLAISFRPMKKEIIACSLAGSVFSVMHTLGHSYDTIDSYGLILKSRETLVSGMLCMLALALTAACVCFMIVRVLNHMRHVCARPGDADEHERKQLFVLSAVMIFLGSVPYLVLYAPGLNIFDTHDQILQFFGYPSYIGDGSALSDHHPVFLSGVYSAFMLLGMAFGDANIGQMIYSLMSMAILAVIWAYALRLLYDLGLKKSACLWIAAFVAVYPVTALYAFNMCKDVSVAPFVLLYVCQMLRIHHSEGGVMRDKSFMLALFANAFMLMLTRKPSMYALAFAALFLIVRYRGVRLRLAAVLLGAVALFHVGYTSLLLPALGVIPGETREMLSIPFQMTARYLNTYPEDVTEEELEAVSRVLDLKAIPNYDPRLSDPVKDTSNPELGDGNLSAYMKAFVSMGMRHPGVYLDAWLNMIYGYFYPSTSNTIVCLTLNSPDAGGIELRQNEELADKRLALHDFIYFTLRRLPGVSTLFYVNTISWMFLLLLLYAVLRGGIGEIAPYMFFFGTLGICLLSPKSGEIRYLMPIFYALPIMLGALILPEQVRAESSDGDGRVLAYEQDFTDASHAEPAQRAAWRNRAACALLRYAGYLSAFGKKCLNLLPDVDVPYGACDMDSSCQRTLKRGGEGMMKREGISYGISLALAIGFALIYYTCTTPLGASIGSDNAMYMTMGTALVEGYAPYTQIFDHKGPLLFVLQTIPQFFGDGYAIIPIFVQQVIFLFVCLRLIDRIAEELHVSGVIFQLIYLALIAANVGGGNLSEEYTNVFTMAGILIILRTFSNGLPRTTKGLFTRAMLLGAMNMLCFLTRANNVLVLCAMTLMIVAWMLAAHRMDLLVRCIGGFVVGLVLYALPAVIWLAYHGALAESVYGAIIHNMMYAETSGQSRLAMLFFDPYGHSAILMAALTLLGAAACARRNPGLALSMVAGAAAGGFSAFISHKFYQHYLLLGAPLAAVGAAKAFAVIRVQWSRLYRGFCAAAAVVCVLYLCIQGVETNRERLSEYEGLDEFTEHAQALYDLVPEDERESFMAYRVEPKWYVAAKALPSMRFYFLQEILADADPAVMDEIVQEFETNPPKWLVLYYNRAFSPPYDRRVAEIFSTQYEFVDARGTYQLKKLKEAP